MATSKFLIEGAAKLGQASMGPDIAGAVQRGLEIGLKPFIEYEKSRKERVNALGRILQTTPNLEELPKIPAQYSPKISEWASNAKNEYADAARALVQMSPDTAEYREAVQKMNNIKTAFVNLDGQLKGIREERIEYLDDYQNDRISAGYINGDLEQAYGLNGAITEIDASGNISLTGANNKSFKWNERQEHFVKSGNVATQWNSIGENASKIGLSGQEKDMSFFIEKARQAIGTYDLPMLKSLVFDDLDGTDVRLDQNIEGIDNPNEVFDILTSPPDREKIQRLKDILAQKTGRALFDVYQKSKTQYDKALRATTGGLTQAQIDKRNQNKANKNRIDNVFKNAINAFNNKNLKASAFDNLVTLIGQDIVPVDLKRGIFKLRDKARITDPDYIPPVINLSDPQNSIQKLYDEANLRGNVDYAELPTFNINVPTEPSVPTEEESRTATNPLLQQ